MRGNHTRGWMDEWMLSGSPSTSTNSYMHTSIHPCIHSFWSSHLLLGRVYSLSQHGQRMEWWWLGMVPVSSLSTCESSRCRPLPPPVVVAVASSDSCRRDLSPCTAMLSLDLYLLILPTHYQEHFTDRQSKLLYSFQLSYILSTVTAPWRLPFTVTAPRHPNCTNNNFNCTVSPLATENPHYSVEGCYLSASPPPSSSVPQCRWGWSTSRSQNITLQKGGREDINLWSSK